MKNRFICFFSQLTLLISFFSSADIQNNPNTLKNEIHRILKKSPIPLSNLTIVVSPVLPAEKELYFSHNADKLFIPASLSKIIVASAVLHYFNPFQQFETLFLSDRPIENRRLKGSLYMKGGGDPSFVSESLWILVNHLHRLGLTSIEGDLILDDYLFKTQKNQWVGDMSRSFNTPLSALSFNWNSVNIYIRPGIKLNDPARVVIDPKNSYIQLENKTKTKGVKKNIYISKLKSKSKKDRISIRGFIPLHGSEFVVYRNISYPIFWVGSHVIEFLSQRNIHFHGRIKRGRVPQSAQELAGYKGRNIFRLIQDMMKYSNNFIADVLTAHLSVKKSNRSVDQGVKQIHKYLESSGIRNYVFVQPSGLSRKNKLKSQDILRVLSRDFSSLYSFEKVSSYPLGGGDGSLKNRFKNLKHPSMIRAKTGWLSGVVGLGGYVRNFKGQTRAFVFLYNGDAKNQLLAQKLIDQLAETLTQY